jgi:hypothetical protein
MSSLESKAMPNRTSFVKFIFGSRLAQFLFVLHLVLVVYAFAQKPRANPDSWESGGSCHGVPIADRVLFYCNETGILKVLATLDFVGIVLFSIFATFFGWLWGPSISFHVVSWVTALVLLACTSFQWMLIGSCIERLLLRSRKKRSNV